MSAGRVKVGLNLSPTEDLRVAALPLFEGGEVDVLELSVDLVFGGAPEWVDALATFFGQEGRLLGHGVEFSAMSAGQDDRRAAWLDQLSAVRRRYRLVHLSEHFGFMTAGDFVGGTPLPVPYTRGAFDVARAHFAELRLRLDGIPLGIENLALAFSEREVDEQPHFIEALLDDLGGFLHLDLHNLYCQAENYGRDPSALLRSYPLGRATKLHLAGGNYFLPDADPAHRFRRDDHERDVPAACLAMLEEALGLCPRLESVIVEHADHALRTEADVAAFQSTFRRVKEIVADHAGVAAAPPPPASWQSPHDSEAPIEGYQRALLEGLDETRDVSEARGRLAADARLSPFRSWVDAFDERALGLGRLLVARWGQRTSPPVPTRMPAARLEAPAFLRFVDAPIPVPGPDQVRLRIEASGVCGTDVHFFRHGVGAPLVLGHEAVGVVDAVGAGVRRPALGDRVGVPWAQAGCGRCARCAEGAWRFCDALRTWQTLGGSHAAYNLAMASACVTIPDGLDPVLAAPLFCAGHTALAALEMGGAEAGSTVAIVGLGGLGHLAVQLAVARGCRVHVVTSNPTKVHDARRFGAHEVHVGTAARESLVRAGGVDVIVSTSSDPSEVGRLAPALRPGGRIAICGLGDAPVSVDAHVLVQRGASVFGVVPGGAEQLPALMTLAAQGRIAPETERYPMTQLRRALYRLADRRVRYRAVLDLRPR